MAFYSAVRYSSSSELWQPPAPIPVLGADPLSPLHATALSATDGAFWATLRSVNERASKHSEIASLIQTHPSMSAAPGRGTLPSNSVCVMRHTHAPELSLARSWGVLDALVHVLLLAEDAIVPAVASMCGDTRVSAADARAALVHGARPPASSPKSTAGLTPVERMATHGSAGRFVLCENAGVIAAHPELLLVVSRLARLSAHGSAALARVARDCVCVCVCVDACALLAGVAGLVSLNGSSYGDAATNTFKTSQLYPGGLAMPQPVEPALRAVACACVCVYTHVCDRVLAAVYDILVADAPVHTSLLYACEVLSALVNVDGNADALGERTKPLVCAITRVCTYVSASTDRRQLRSFEDPDPLMAWRKYVTPVPGSLEEDAASRVATLSDPRIDVPSGHVLEAAMMLPSIRQRELRQRQAMMRAAEARAAQNSAGEAGSSAVCESVCVSVDEDAGASVDPEVWRHVTPEALRNEPYRDLALQRRDAALCVLASMCSRRSERVCACLCEAVAADAACLQSIMATLICPPIGLAEAPRWAAIVVSAMAARPETAAPVLPFVSSLTACTPIHPHLATELGQMLRSLQAMSGTTTST